MTKTVTAAEAAGWIAEGEALLIDVRSPAEYRAEHIAAAVSLPLDSLPGALAALNPPAGRKLVFQCLKGGRGASACAAVAAAAPDSYNLEGGIEAWKAAGLPVTRDAAEGLPIFRQVQIAVGLMVLALVAAGFTVAPVFFALAGVMGFMFALAGATGRCVIAMLLARAPWNRPARA